MSKQARALSAFEVRRLTKPGTHAVSGAAGLLLQVTRTGARSWILWRTAGDKRRDIGLGAFPDVTLAQARDAAREARTLIRQRVDPAAQRAAERQALIASQRKALTFAEAAQHKHDAIACEFRNAKHRKQWLSTLEQYAFSVLGDMEIDRIEFTHVIAVLNPIQTTKTETASRVRQRMEAVFTWTIVSDYRGGRNPAGWKGNLADVLPAPARSKQKEHHRALLWADMPAFMVALRQRNGVATRALEFAILTAARSAEVRLATWAEFDLDAGLQIVSAEHINAGKAYRAVIR